MGFIGFKDFFLSPIRLHPMNLWLKNIFGFLTKIFSFDYPCFRNYALRLDMK